MTVDFSDRMATAILRKNYYTVRHEGPFLAQITARHFTSSLEQSLWATTMPFKYLSVDDSFLGCLSTSSFDPKCVANLGPLFLRGDIAIEPLKARAASVFQALGCFGANIRDISDKVTFQLLQNHKEAHHDSTTGHRHQSSIARSIGADREA